MHHDERVHRDLSAHLSLDVTSPATLAFELAVSTQVTARESWNVTLDGAPVEVTEVPDHHGTRLHVVHAGVGRLVLDYSASVDGRASRRLRRSDAGGDALAG